MRELKREGEGEKVGGGDHVEDRGQLYRVGSLHIPLHGGWALGIEFEVTRLVWQAPLHIELVCRPLILNSFNSFIGSLLSY